MNDRFLKKDFSILEHRQASSQEYSPLPLSSKYSDNDLSDQEMPTELLTDQEKEYNQNSSISCSLYPTSLHSSFPKTSIPSTLISCFKDTVPLIRVPPSLMYLYSHPNSYKGWTNPQRRVEESIMQESKPSKHFCPSQIRSIIELRNQYLLKPPFHYPHTYRQEIWEMLLELPKSQSAYNTILEEYQRRQFDPDMVVRLPVGDALIQRRLETMVNSIGLWCSDLKDVRNIN